LARSFLRPAVGGLRLKYLGFAKLQNHSRAGHPIRAFALNQMAENIEGTPSVFAFVLERPFFRKIAEKGTEGSGGVGEKRYCVRQVMFHESPQSADSSFSKTLIIWNLQTFSHSVDAQIVALILFFQMFRSTTNLVCCCVSRPIRRRKGNQNWEEDTQPVRIKRRSSLIPGRRSPSTFNPIT
jgi:hypothetical protein